MTNQQAEREVGTLGALDPARAERVLAIDAQVLQFHLRPFATRGSAEVLGFEPRRTQPGSFFWRSVPVSRCLPAARYPIGRHDSYVEP